MLKLKKIKFAPSSNERTPWDRHALVNFSIDGESYDFPPSAVKYFVAGCIDKQYFYYDIVFVVGFTHFIALNFFRSSSCKV